MSLAIFDLDNTLIAGDSDHAWGEFLVEQGIVDAKGFAEENDRFYQDYCNGKLDIQAYLRFALTPLKQFDTHALTNLHKRFMASKIDGIKLNKAVQLVQEHRDKGDVLLVITATNRFVTEPIVRWFGIDNLLASDAEIVDGRYTGEPIGVPCFAEGKVQRLKTWLAEQPADVQNMDRYFYSDSRNDLPLLNIVDHPIAVDPDPVLEVTAKQKGWDVISLR